MSFLAQISKLFGSKTSAVVAATAPKAKNASRSVAKERLSVILASQRGSELMAGVDMVLLQQDVLAVVKVRLELHGFKKIDSASIK
jgi:septum formation topological specificity factor MinE